jgi:hypothetical protein
MKKFLPYSLMAVLILAVALSGCGNTPTPTGTYSLSPSSSNLKAIGNQIVNFSFTTTQDSGYGCTWNATASNGSSINETGAAFSWTTPTVLKDYTVTAKVVKGGQTVETKTWTVFVCKSVNIPVTVLTTDEQNSLPPSRTLEGVTVEIYGAGLEYKGISKADGTVTLSNVPAGEYYLRCSKTGYITTYHYVASDIPDNCTLDIRPTLVTWSTCNVMLEVTLDQTKSIIMGAVHDSIENSFKGLSGATVSISPSDVGTIKYLGGGQTTSEFAYGIYCIYNLPSQNYTLTAFHNSKTFSPNPITIDLTKSGEAAIYCPDQFTAQ